MKKIYSNKWFSIIEILIGMLIFTLWLISIFMLISTTIRINENSKNEIIWANLAKESIELLRNIRDSNYKNLHKWNQINPNEDTDYDKIFGTGSYYIIENNFDANSVEFPISMSEITDFAEWESELLTKMESYRLCLDTQNRYTYDCTNPDNKETYFYRYVYLDEVRYNNEVWNEIIREDAMKVISKVIWYNRWYHDTEVKTIITDWKKL